MRLTVKGVKTSVNEKYLSTSLITCLLEQVTAGERLNEIPGYERIIAALLIFQSSSIVEC